MRAADLVRMLNQIAANQPRGEPEAAAEAVAEHVRAFWEPRMRRDLAAHLSAGGEGLSEVARAGAERVAAREATAA